MTERKKRKSINYENVCSSFPHLQKQLNIHTPSNNYIFVASCFESETINIYRDLYIYNNLNYKIIFKNLLNEKKKRKERKKKEINLLDS